MDDAWDTFDCSAFGYDHHHPDDIHASMLSASHPWSPTGRRSN
jgi:hypothetical protein